jgi:hypothetical protein
MNTGELLLGKGRFWVKLELGFDNKPPLFTELLIPLWLGLLLEVDKGKERSSYSRRLRN